MHKIENMDKYFKEYRKKIAEQKAIEHDRKMLIHQIQSMDTMLSNVNFELECMRRVISLMIERDLDPVEAKLRVDETQPIIIDNAYDADIGLSTISYDSMTGSSTADLSISSISWPYSLNKTV